MTLPAEAFDRRCEIWRDVPGAKNALGEATTTPTKIGKFWAARNYFGKRSWNEAIEAGQVVGSETTQFTLRYSTITADIKTTDRLVYKGQSYNIRGVQEFGFGEMIDVFVDGLVS